jgi:hypothetical protein
MNQITKQKGTTTVEFALVGLLAIVILLAVIEFSRLLFVINTMGEATRRGARMAAVCPIDDPAIAQTAVFNQSGGGTDSPIISGLSTANVQLEYLDQGGNPVATPADPNGFLQIRYVRVSIVNFQHQLVLPLPLGPLSLPELPSTLPRESLGVPRRGVIQPC